MFFWLMISDENFKSDLLFNNSIMLEKTWTNIDSVLLIREHHHSNFYFIYLECFAKNFYDIPNQIVFMPVSNTNNKVFTELINLKDFYNILSNFSTPFTQT